MAAFVELAGGVSQLEVELKLLIDAADIAKLRRHPLLKSLCPAGPDKRQLLSIYYDTDDLFLKRNGIALRVRRDGQRWVQTVKGGGGVVAGLHQRNEWEAELAQEQPDFALITEPAMAALFADEALRRRLKPVFVTEFSRTAWHLKTPQGDEIELALDVGDIRAGNICTPISEIELELKIGQAAALFELALELQQRVPLIMGNASKAERGYALNQPEAPLIAAKAALPELRPEMSVNEAFLAIAWNCLHPLQCNQDAMRHGYDAEFVHQMRVAIRRLRSAMRLFARLAPGIHDARMDAELRWLVGELAPARDWDVLLEGLIEPLLAKLTHDAGMKWLYRQALKQRQVQRDRALTAAASQRCQQLLLRLCAWLYRTPWDNAQSAIQLKQPITWLADEVLVRQQRKTLRSGRQLDALSAEQRHTLRIAVKRLRYGVEFFSGLYGEKMVQAYLSHLQQLQDVLGALNDQAVAMRLLSEMAAGVKSGTRMRALGVVEGWCLAQSDMQLAKLRKRWKRFKRSKYFWGQQLTQ